MQVSTVLTAIRGSYVFIGTLINVQHNTENVPEKRHMMKAKLTKGNQRWFVKDIMLLKVPGPIASDFSQMFGDFGIIRDLIFFSLPLVNFTAEKCTVRKKVVKM